MSVYGTVICKLELRGFSWKHFRSLRFRRTSMLCLEDPPTDLPVGLLHSQTGTSNTRMIFRTPSPHRTCTWCRNINLLPIDYASQPGLRGRLMNVEQETLGLRRAGFSPALTLLMSAFALLIPPAVLSNHLRRLTERSPTTCTHRANPRFRLLT